MTAKLNINSISQFDEESGFRMILGFTAYWDYQLNKDNVNGKIVYMMPEFEFHSKSGCTDRSNLLSLRDPILFLLFS